MFLNSWGYNTAAINLNCKSGNVTLKYALSDNPVQHHWQRILSNTKEYKMAIPMNISVQEAVTMFNQICDEINFQKISDNFTQKELNILHRELVDNFTTNLDHRITNLNNLIHVLEQKINNKYSDFNSTILFYSKDNEQCIPVEEKFKLWLSPNSQWGDLFIGYGTIGKDWSDICIDTDDEDSLAVQKTISSETCMYFKTEYNYPKAEETLLYRWSLDNNTCVPLDNLNQLSLGRYFLGKLIIDDQFLDFHNFASDWYVPNHKCKLLWNKHIIGSNVMINNIKFYNSNEYFETLDRHSGIHDL